MIYIVLAIVILYSLWVYVPKIILSQRKIGKLEAQLKQLQSNWSDSQVHISELIEQKQKLFHQKKSSEVKTGQTVEQLIGFLDEFPYPNDEIKALFQPIDLLVFREDEIVFIEVKSGDAQLSDKQRKIRDLINDKKVRFETHRVNGKGYKIK